MKTQLSQLRFRRSLAHFQLRHAHHAYTKPLPISTADFRESHNIFFFCAQSLMGMKKDPTDPLLDAT